MSFYTAQLGTSDSYPGNIVLGFGGAQLASTASDTISFTESATETISYPVAATDTLSITEAATVTGSFGVAATDSLSLTESNFGAVPLKGSQSDTITFTDTALVVHVKNGSVTETITFTDSCRTPDVFSSSAADTISFGDGDVFGQRTLLATAIDNLSISEGNSVHTDLNKAGDTIFWGESATGYDSLAPVSKDTLAFTESAHKNLIPSHPVADNLVFVETALAQTKLTRQQSDLLNFTESADRGPITRNLSADADTITFTEDGIGYIVRITADTITFTDDASSDLVKAVTESLTFTEHGEGIGRQVLTDKLVITESAKGGRSRAVQVNEAIIFADSAQGHHLYDASVSETITFADESVLSRYVKSTSDSITLTDSATNHPSYKRTATDTLNLTEAATTNKTLVRSASDTLVITETKFDPLEGVFVNGTIGTKIGNQFLLRTAAGTVTLPRPEFGDSENTTNEFNLRYAMTGQVHTTIKRRRLNRRLVYTFNLSRRQERELVQFLSVSNDKYMSLLNWKGEQWKVKLLSNPIQSNNIGFDRFRVELEFEGIQLTSGGVNQCQC